MAIYFHNPNFGLSPNDPKYDRTFDEDEEYELYLSALEDREESARER